MSVTLLVFLAGALFLYFRERTRKGELAASLEKTKRELAEARNDVATATNKSELERRRADAIAVDLAEAHSRLEAIQGLGEIEDAFTYSARIREFAERELQNAKATLRSAEVQAKALISEAEAEARTLRQQAEAMRARALNEGEAESARLIAAAESQASEIAGSAYELSKRERELKKIIQALENTVKGYGDEYLVPSSVVLDELEHRYGFSDVGRSMKDARKRVSDMIKTGKGANCDYVETNRRETAIAFVLDAFNGKVDSILAGVKHDNFGKLSQKVKDAFTLVNFLGAAFRNARIEQAYLDVQMEVLKWAVAAHELKRLEKEEQRALREQMREEEKARREYEKALKEASRDEEVARKAVEKARADLEKAGDAERAKYEAKLAELAEKLKAAEERGQRALSMAQQTRSGNVYVISNVGSFGEDVYKIGMTRRLEPEDRVKELGDASVPFSFDIHAMIPTEDAPVLEKALHKRFLREQINKVNPRKEFFRVSLADIRAEVERMNIQGVWTMTAACAEWRESQVIAERLAKDAGEFAKWSETQLREHERAMLVDVEGEDA